MAGIRVVQLVMDQLLNFVQLVDRGVAVHEQLAAGFADAAVVHQIGKQSVPEIAVEGAVIASQG